MLLGEPEAVAGDWATEGGRDQPVVRLAGLVVSLAVTSRECEVVCGTADRAIAILVTESTRILERKGKKKLLVNAPTGPPDLAVEEADAVCDETEDGEFFSKNFLLMLKELNFFGCVVEEWELVEPNWTREGRGGGVFEDAEGLSAFWGGEGDAEPSLRTCESTTSCGPLPLSSAFCETAWVGSADSRVVSCVLLAIDASQHA